MTNYSQKRSRYKTTLDFGPERLDHTFSYFNNRSGASIKYEQIPLEWRLSGRKNWRAKYISAGFACFGIVMGTAIMGEQSERNIHAMQSGLTFMATCLACAVLLYFFERVFRPSTEFTVIPAKPEIRIIHDGREKEIEAEILKHRRDALRAKLMNIDPLNAPGTESRKFRWLREENIITDEEYANAVLKLAGARTDEALAAAKTEQNRKLH
ncbi:MAG TPA: hypothetical protein VL625_04935 [Patescibacteria group bacterium]|nr:hypothetical protein [Patescibacteria group bacterium]